MSTPPGEPPQEPDHGQFGPQPGQQPDYGQYGQQQGSWGAPPQTNGLAVGALIASLLGLLCGIGFIVGIVLGYSARGQIRQSGGAQGGDGLATAAIIIGWVGVVLMVFGFLFFFAFFFALATSGTFAGF